MNTNATLCRQLRLVPLVAAAFALALFPAVARGIEVSPAEIEFNKIESPATVSVTQNGEKVPASAISSVKLYVGSYDYDHMIKVTKSDGQITVQPTEMLELGTYDLVVKTASGNATVAVKALLNIVDESLGAQASRQGITVEEVKARLGISQPLGLERIKLGLPKLYYKGQTLRLALDVKEDRVAEWIVNGKPVKSEGGKLAYTFDQAGVHDIAYVEKKDGKTIAIGFGAVLVIAEPPIPVETAAGTQLKLLAPEGYQKFTWKLDGAAAEGTDSWTGVFDEPGAHKVTVRAESPADGTEQVFREITFSITVS